MTLPHIDLDSRTGRMSMDCMNIHRMMNMDSRSYSHSKMDSRTVGHIHSLGSTSLSCCNHSSKIHHSSCSCSCKKDNMSYNLHKKNIFHIYRMMMVHKIGKDSKMILRKIGKDSRIIHRGMMMRSLSQRTYLVQVRK